MHSPPDTGCVFPALWWLSCFSGCAPASFHSPGSPDSHGALEDHVPWADGLRLETSTERAYCWMGRCSPGNRGPGIGFHPSSAEREVGLFPWRDLGHSGVYSMQITTTYSSLQVSENAFSEDIARILLPVAMVGARRATN